MNVDDFKRDMERARTSGMPLSEAYERAGNMIPTSHDHRQYEAHFRARLEPHLKAHAEAWFDVMSLAFGKPSTVDDWIGRRPTLWRLRARWRWAGEKPYEHIWTPGGAGATSYIHTHTLSAGRRQAPPEDTLRRAWWDVGAAVVAAARATWREMRAVGARLRRTVRGR